MRAPAFLHFGFAMAAPEEVRGLKAKLREAGVTIVERDEEPGPPTRSRT
jgi:hypothetical protein